MAIHLVGDTIDKTRSHYRAETGKLVQLMRGIYVDADDDVDATVLRHAVRVAKYLYPNAYLSAASAILLGPARDGRLFLSGRRKQRTRLRGLEIIQNEAPRNPSLGSAIIDDGMGEFRVNVSSLRQRFLEAFRVRSEHAASIDELMRDAVAARLVEEYGSPLDASTAVWVLARENEWYREGERAERYLMRKPALGSVRNEATLNLIIAWHGKPVGHLSHDGFEWRWTVLDRKGPTLIRQTIPGKLPSFIISLLPEGWLQSILNDKDPRATLRSGRRYMSNITIAEHESELAVLPRDVLVTSLERYETNGIFTGVYAGPSRGEIDEGFERNLARLYENNETPRLSGIQIKAPMYLDDSGTLTPSITMPFTHILKPAGTSGYEALPIIEWLALVLGRAVEFVVPRAALVPMPGGMPPALVVERFDIRRGMNDTTMLALEDMCSVLELPPEAKYDGTMEQVARAVRPLSTAPEEDILILLKRALFAWLIADGDMHLKNMALLKTAETGSDTFHSVRIAPLYDAVTTRVFPRLERDRLALKLNGKDDKLRRSDFRKFASTAGLRMAVADAAIDRMLELMNHAISGISLPAIGDGGALGIKVAERMLEIVRARLASFS